MAQPKVVTCKFCERPGHSAFNCRYKKRKPLARKTSINKMGKVAKQWEVTRTTWLRKNPPDARGFYYCYICHRSLYPNQLTIDHIRSRTRAPELRFNLDNLAACCWLDNQAKKSLDLEQYLEKRKQTPLAYIPDSSPAHFPPLL